MTQKYLITFQSFPKLLLLGAGLLLGFSAGSSANQSGPSEVRLLRNMAIVPQADKNLDAINARLQDRKQASRKAKDTGHSLDGHSLDRQSLDRHYLVQFHDAPVSQLLAQQQSVAGLAKSGASVKASLLAQKAQVTKGLQQRRNALEQATPGLKVVNEHSVLFNGLHVQVSATQAASLAQRTDVKAVFPVKKRYLSLDASHQVTKTLAAWEALGGQSEAGKGVKIAVVDTGIRHENPMFDDAGFTAPDLSGNSHLAEHPDYCRSDSGDAGFCNNKLIVARAMDPAQHGMEVYSGEYLSPKAFDGHGTHVAGIAAGNPVSIEYNRANVALSGAAPGAWLMVYKALYMSNLGFAFGTDTMLLEALEMAVLDGADVINNSWGAGSGEDPDASIYQEVFANAEALGIVVVNAAGNTGHPGATINCPACIESGIAVANSTHGRFFGHRLTVNGKTFLAYQGANNQIASDLTLTLASLNSVMPLDDSGCEPVTQNSDFFAGSLVLVDYKPFCPLETVASNIAALGGDAVLIYQAGAFGTATYEPFIPLQSSYDIPVFGMSRENGLTIVDDAYAADFTVTIANEVEQGIEAQYVDIINPFSSTGPNNNPSVLKPDMAAPGTFVLSAYSPDEFSFGSPFDDAPGGPGGPGDAPMPGTGSNEPVFAMLTGTSMASPQVAGAAALLRQQYPDWSARQIKAALMSTSNPNTLLGLDPANAFVQGAGRLDTFAALNSQLDFERVSYAQPGCIGECVFINQVRNLADSEQTWRFDVTFFDGDTQAVVQPAVIDFAAAGSTGDHMEVRVVVDTSRADPEHRLYDKWVFGRLTATNSEGKTQHLPLVAYANDASDVGTLVVAHDGTDLQSQNDIVYQTRVRNKGTDTVAELVLTAPDNAMFVAGSESVTLNRATSEAMTLDSASEQLTWRGNLEMGSFALAAGELPAWGDFTLATAEVAPLPCSDGCNGFTTLVEFDYQYHGQDYNTLTISDNGFVVPGSVNFGFLTALFNQRFPQEDNLNNIIAPFWTEFDLLDENQPGDTGGGYLRAAVRVLDEINYLVVEWDNVQPYVIDEGLPGEEDEFPGDDFPGDQTPEEPSEDELPVDTPPASGFTFQLIIEENTNNIWFNYLQIPYEPDFLSIGAENMDGSIGINGYFDGEGTLNLIAAGEPGNTEQLTSEPEGTALVAVALRLTDEQDYATADNLSAIEDTAITLDVLANDVAETFVTLAAELSLGQNHQAISTSLVPATAGLDAQTLEIVSVPANGQASVTDGQLLYTPNDDFFGNEQLTYRVADGAGKFSKAIEVSLNVTAVNDAPTLAAIADMQVEEGAIATFTVVAEDIDSASITYDWTQTAGEITALQVTDNQFQLTAPSVDSDAVLTYHITASDGELQSAPQSVNITVTAQRSSGGSLFWLPLLLCLVCLSRVRR